MGLQAWGGLQKSATDDETIEEAIDRLIISHNDDTEAHLGAGKSLEAHKTSEVIDHPARSLVPDKFSNSASFLSLNTYPVETGETVNCSIQGGMLWLGVNQTSPVYGDGTALFTMLQPYELGYDDGDILFDFILYGVGYSGTWNGAFEFTWGKIEIKYGYYRVGYYTTSWQYSSWSAINVSYPLRFRFEYDSVNSLLSVFLRDIQVFSHSFTPYFIDDETMLMQFLINRGSATACSLYFGSAKIWMSGI